MAVTVPPPAGEANTRRGPAGAWKREFRQISWFLRPVAAGVVAAAPAPAGVGVVAG